MTIEGHLICSQFLMIINKVTIKSAYEFSCDDMFSFFFHRQTKFALTCCSLCGVTAKKKAQNNLYSALKGKYYQRVITTFIYYMNLPKRK